MMYAPKRGFFTRKISTASAAAPAARIHTAGQDMLFMLPVPKP